MRRVPALAFALLGVTTAIGACASTGTATGTGAAIGASGSTGANGSTVMAHGSFVSATAAPSGTTAYAYDTALVPPGAMAELTLTVVGGDTDARLAVVGLVPNHAYGAHLHLKPCGADPKAAGAHYENNPDPSASQSPSTNPTYANPTNEVWLDFTTDASGGATSSAQVPWVASGDRRPHALVLHATTTLTAPGTAGTAGARVACLTIPA